MSRVRADKLVNRAGSGAPELTYGAQVVTGMGITGAGGINITGVATAGSFVGNITGNVTGNADTATSATTATNASGLTGTPDITVDGITANDINVSGSCTITGNLTVDGTQTIVNTSTLDIADKTVGIASTTAATDATADGAGIEIYASSSVASNNKTILWQRDTGCFEFSEPTKHKGVVETVAAATTHADTSGNIVLELDMAAATTFTHTIPAVSSAGRGSNIGIVSFKNMPADNGVANGQTVTVIFTQASSAHGGATGYGNTVATNGIGATCNIAAFEDGSVKAGISTRAFVGGGTGAASTVTLSPEKNDIDFVSFFVQYTGGTNTDLKSYKVYATKNGGFNQGNVGV